MREETNRCNIWIGYDFAIHYDQERTSLDYVSEASIAKHKNCENDFYLRFNFEKICMHVLCSTLLSRFNAKFQINIYYKSRS